MKKTKTPRILRDDKDFVDVQSYPTVKMKTYTCTPADPMVPL